MSVKDVRPIKETKYPNGEPAWQVAYFDPTAFSLAYMAQQFDSEEKAKAFRSHLMSKKRKRQSVTTDEGRRFL